jgi:hypothetical protein
MEQRVAQQQSKAERGAHKQCQLLIVGGYGCSKGRAFQPLPAEVVEILPQYRGYNFFAVRDDIMIVEPSTYKIVDVLPRTGRSTAAAPAPSPHKATFSGKDREIHP